VPTDQQIRSLFQTVPPLDTTETFADTELPLEPPRAQTAKALKSEHVPQACLLAAAKGERAAGQ